MSILKPAQAHNAKRAVDCRPRGRPRTLARSSFVALSALLSLALSIEACASAIDKPDNAAALADIAHGRSGDEVIVEGTALRRPTERLTRSGTHEYIRLTIRGDANQTATITIVHNVGIAPFVNVAPGDDLIVKGELAFDPADGGPLLHWTHHDPRYRHPTGFIEWHGKFYE